MGVDRLRCRLSICRYLGLVLILIYDVFVMTSSTNVVRQADVSIDGLIELLLLFHEHVVGVRKMRQSDDGSVR